MDICRLDSLNMQMGQVTSSTNLDSAIPFDYLHVYISHLRLYSVFMDLFTTTNKRYFFPSYEIIIFDKKMKRNQLHVVTHTHTHTHRGRERENKQKMGIIYRVSSMTVGDRQSAVNDLIGKVCAGRVSQHQSNLLDSLIKVRTEVKIVTLLSKLRLSEPNINKLTFKGWKRCNL